MLRTGKPNTNHMATKIKTNIKRETSRMMATPKGRIEMPDKLGFTPMGVRPVIVTLTQAETINFRVKNTKTTVSLPLSSAMAMAQVMSGYENYRQRVETYNLKKKAGYKRLRKPVRPHFPHLAKFFSALR